MIRYFYIQEYFNNTHHPPLVYNDQPVVLVMNRHTEAVGLNGAVDQRGDRDAERTDSFGKIPFGKLLEIAHADIPPPFRVINVEFFFFRGLVDAGFDRLLHVLVGPAVHQPEIAAVLFDRPNRCAGSGDSCDTSRKSGPARKPSEWT